MSRPIARPLTLLTLIAMLTGLSGLAPGGANAGTTSDAPTFEPIATQTVTLPDAILGADDSEEELISLTWQADWLPTLSEGDDPVPFAPGFLYSPDAMLLLFRENGRFDRLPSGDAVGTDGSIRLAPVSYDGQVTEVLAVELVAADPDAVEPDDSTFSLAVGDWELTLWSMVLPVVDSAVGVTLGDQLAGDITEPVLVMVVTGAASLITEDGGNETIGEALSLVEAPVRVRNDGDDPATVIAVTIGPDGDESARPNESARTRITRNGTSVDPSGPSGTRSASASASGSAAPNGSVSPRPSPSPAGPDSDGDFLSDADEAIHGTDPNDEDTDNDQVIDGFEILDGTDPLDDDSDDDGESDFNEDMSGLDPNNPDTDGDGLLDGPERLDYGTDPQIADTDGDLRNDGQEVRDGTNPVVYDEIDYGGSSSQDGPGDDPDGDGILNQVEDRLGTGRRDADSDDDGLTDGEEFNRYGTNPTQADPDGDGLSDQLEVIIYATNPSRFDSDGDRLGDGDEVNRFLNPNVADMDGDCLTDGTEVAIGTDPAIRDTDGDGVDDGSENSNSNPLDPDDSPGYGEFGACG